VAGEGLGQSNREEIAVRLSRPIRLAWPALLPAVVIALFLPTALASAAPTHPPDPASAARAIARHHAPVASDADAVVRPDRAAAARAQGRYYASFGDERLIGPAVAAADPVSAEPDGPTWVAAMIAGVLAAIAAAGLGAVAGRRTVRVPHA